MNRIEYRAVVSAVRVRDLRNPKGEQAPYDRFKPAPFPPNGSLTRFFSCPLQQVDEKFKILGPEMA